MNYKSFNLGDWIGHISGVIEDETTLDGNEMRDLVEFLTTLNQQPCEDCISRQAVKEILHKRGQKAVITFEHFEELVNKLPPATPQPKTGHWIADVDRWGDIVTTVNGYRCDKCNTFNSDKDNYCPNCGAKMVEPQESEDKGMNCGDCILDGTDACSRGAGRAIDDEPCGDFIGTESEDKE